MRFPRAYRLVTKAEFKAVFDKSLKISQKNLLILYTPNQTTHARLGLIVGKRVANTAVGRNRIKRLVRESFRSYHEKINQLDIVVIARHQCDTLSNQNLRKGIDDLWEKLLTQSASK